MILVLLEIIAYIYEGWGRGKRAEFLENRGWVGKVKRTRDRREIGYWSDAKRYRSLGKNRRQEILTPLCPPPPVNFRSLKTMPEFQDIIIGKLVTGPRI